MRSPAACRPIDNTLARPAITLICARHQRVLIPGREPILAPVMAALEEVKRKVLADSYYALKYDEKREITILDWPLRELPLDRAEALKSAARKRAYDLKQVGQSTPDDAEVVYRKLPAGLLAKLPDNAMARPLALDAKGIPVAYPNRDVYVRDGQKIYRVEKLSCVDPAAKCGSFDNLSVQGTQSARGTARSSPHSGTPQVSSARSRSYLAASPPSCGRPTPGSDSTWSPPGVNGSPTRTWRVSGCITNLTPRHRGGRLSWKGAIATNG